MTNRPSKIAVVNFARAGRLLPATSGGARFEPRRSHGAGRRFNGRLMTLGGLNDLASRNPFLTFPNFLPKLTPSNG